MDGTNAGGGVSGLFIAAGSSTVRGLVINRFSGSGISLVANGGNTIVGNYIGTNTDGTVSLPNTDGIWLGNSTHNNTIGGTTAEERNVISGNTIYGISVNYWASANQFIGNFLGTDRTGTLPLGNGGGIILGSGSNNNAIGGLQAGAGNLISGNWWSGVFISDPETTGNTVQGNYIGTDATGTTTTGPSGLPPEMFKVTPVEGTCPTYVAGTDYNGFVSQSEDPLAPWSGTSVHFKGTNECSSPEMLGAASLIYRYRLEFAEDTPLTSIAVSGAAFNGPDSVLRVLDEGMNVLGTLNTFGGNSFQTPYITLQGVEGKVFYVDEFDTSTTWRFRKSFIVNGSLPLGNYGGGVLIANAASGNLVGGKEESARNIISGNRANGVSIFNPGTNGNTLQGNFIGTDASGKAALPNSGVGVWVGDGASETLIGGKDPIARNVISGNNGDGVSINGAGTMGTVVRGNYIGTNSSGTVPLPNLYNGVTLISGTNNNQIEKNLISGNGGDGVGIYEPGTTGNMVRFNKIGTDVTGTVALGNNVRGVFVAGGASDNFIKGNLISGNWAAGIRLSDAGTERNKIQGNFIGTDATGKSALGNGFVGIRITDGAANNLIGGMGSDMGNTIAFNAATGIALNFAAGSGNSLLSNSVFSNGGLGIDLGEDGVTPNDQGDGDSDRTTCKISPLSIIR